MAKQIIKKIAQHVVKMVKMAQIGTKWWKCSILRMPMIMISAAQGKIRCKEGWIGDLCQVNIVKLNFKNGHKSCENGHKNGGTDRIG